MLGAVLPGARQLAADVGMQRQLDVPPVQVRLGLRVDAGVVCTCRGEMKARGRKQAEGNPVRTRVPAVIPDSLAGTQRQPYEDKCSWWGGRWGAPLMRGRVLAPAGWSRSMSPSWRACLAGAGRQTSA